MILAILLPLLVLSTLGTSLNPHETSLAAAATLQAKELWSVPLNQSTVQSPVLYGGLIYVASTPSNSSVTSLYCVNASSGNVVWTRTDYYSSFTVANGCVYVGATLLAPVLYAQGVVYCLDASSGALLWETNVTGYVIGSPTVDGNCVYVSANMFTINTDTATGHVYAINALTGKEIWSFTGALGTSFDSPIVAGGVVYVLSAYTTVNTEDAFTGAISSVYAIQAATGTDLWNYSVNALLGSIILADGNIYVSCNYYNATQASDLISDYYAGGILCFNGQNGLLLWNDTVRDVANFFTVADGAVYLAADTELISGHSNVLPDSGFVYAFNAANGSAKWNQTVNLSVGSTLFADGCLYVGSTRGVYCLAAANGTVIWTFSAKSYEESSPTYPAYANGVIYVGWNGPMFYSPEPTYNFYALNAANGQKLWSTALPYTITATPLAVNGTIYVGSSSVTTMGQNSGCGGAVLAYASNDSPLLIGNAILPVTVAAIITAGAVTVLALMKIGKRRKPSV